MRTLVKYLVGLSTTLPYNCTKFVLFGSTVEIDVHINGNLFVGNKTNIVVLPTRRMLLRGGACRNYYKHWTNSYKSLAAALGC